MPTLDEYELLGVEREAGKPAFALARLSSTPAAPSGSGCGNVSRSTQGRRQRAWSGQRRSGLSPGWSAVWSICGGKTTSATPRCRTFGRN